MMKSFLKLSIVLYFASSSAFAAPQLGPFRLYPEIGISFQHNDNIALENTNETSSVVTILTPRATLVGRRPAQTYSLSLGADIGRYSNSPNSVDNYEDMNLLANADLQLSRLSGLSVGAFYLLGHDERGTTDRNRTSNTVLDTYAIAGGNALFSYSQARIGYEGEVGYSAKRYKDYSLPEKLDDTDTTNVAGRLLYRVMPKTRVFAEVAYQQTDYVLATSTQDSDQWGFSVGARWTATAKTSGTAQIGYLKTDFDATGVEGFTGVAWQIGVQWKPLRRSTVDIYTGKTVQNSTGIGDFIETQDLSVSWTQNWMPRLSTNLGFYLANSKFGGSGTTQEEDLTRFNFGVNYLMKRMTVSAGVSFVQNDSTSSIGEYDQTIYMISIHYAI